MTAKGLRWPKSGGTRVVGGGGRKAPQPYCPNMEHHQVRLSDPNLGRRSPSRQRYVTGGLCHDTALCESPTTLTTSLSLARWTALNPSEMRSLRLPCTTSRTCTIRYLSPASYGDSISDQLSGQECGLER